MTKVHIYYFTSDDKLQYCYWPTSKVDADSEGCLLDFLRSRVSSETRPRDNRIDITIAS